MSDRVQVNDVLGVREVEARDEHGLVKVVLASFLGLTVCGGPILMYTQSLFLGPMTAEFGWSRSAYFLPLSLAGIIGALATPVIGGFADRQGVRRWLLGGILGLALCTMAMAFLNGAVWLFTLLVIGAILASAAHGPLLYTKAVAEWATSRPGLALAFVLAGAAVGGLVTPPLTTWLIDDYGWRAARVALGVLTIAVALPMAWAFIRPPPPAQQSVTVSMAGCVDESGLSLGEAIRTTLFARILLGIFAAGLALNGLIGYLRPLLTDRGVDAGIAAAALSGFAIAQLVGRFLSGMALDRINTSMVGAIWFIGAVLGAALIGFSFDWRLVIFGAVLTGAALGSELELGAYFALRFFGRLSYGKIYGLMMAVYTVGATSGPLMLGYLHDLTGNNRAGVLVLMAELGLTAVLFATLGAYRYALVQNPGGAPADRA